MNITHFLLLIVQVSLPLCAMNTPPEDVPISALAGAVIFVKPVNPQSNWHLASIAKQGATHICGHQFDAESVHPQLTQPTHTITCPEIGCTQEYEVCPLCNYPIIEISDRNQRNYVSVDGCGVFHSACLMKYQANKKNVVDLHCPACKEDRKLHVCLLCLDEIPLPREKYLKRCGHTFHPTCLDNYTQEHGPYCPCCNTVSGKHWYKHPERWVNLITQHDVLRHRTLMHALQVASVLASWKLDSMITLPIYSSCFMIKNCLNGIPAGIIASSTNLLTHTIFNRLYNIQSTCCPPTRVERRFADLPDKVGPYSSFGCLINLIRQTRLLCASPYKQYPFIMYNVAKSIKRIITNPE